MKMAKINGQCNFRQSEGRWLVPAGEQQVAAWGEIQPQEEGVRVRGSTPVTLSDLRQLTSLRICLAAKWGP